MESGDCYLLLAKAANEKQKSMIGNQTGGRVFLFLHTDNFKRDYQNLLNNGIKIVREPVEEKYGIVAVFQDIYGNHWDLIEPIIPIIPRPFIRKMPTGNTDNMGKLFPAMRDKLLTLFAFPAPKTNL